jgi:hypothetical protein
MYLTYKYIFNLSYNDGETNWVIVRQLILELTRLIESFSSFDEKKSILIGKICQWDFIVFFWILMMYIDK